MDQVNSHLKKDFNEANIQVFGCGGHLGGDTAVSRAWEAPRSSHPLRPPPSLPLSSYFLRLFVMKMETHTVSLAF